MIDSIIFDVDGTLWDSTGVVEKAWNQALSDKGFTQRVTKDDLKGLFGLPMDDIIERILPAVPLEKRLEFKPFCFSYEHDYLEKEAGALYDGFEETLEYLSKKYPLFIVSNCQGGYIELFFRKTGFEKYFKGHLCPGDTNLLKADNILKIKADYGLVNPVYVGDTHMDEEACQKAGVRFAFASYGFGHCVNPDYVINSPSELTTLF